MCVYGGGGVCVEIERMEGGVCVCFSKSSDNYFQAFVISGFFYPAPGVG